MFEEPVLDAQGFDDQPFEALDLAPATPVVGWAPASLVIGGAIVAIAVSGLLDDSGLIEHPYWAVPAACLFTACAAVAGRTVRRLIGYADGHTAAV